MPMRAKRRGWCSLGVLELWVGEAHHRLEAGDSFAFDSATPHRYRNPSETETIVIWALTPPSF